MTHERSTFNSDSGAIVQHRKRNFRHSLHSHKVRSFIWAAIALVFWGMFLAGVGK